MDETWEKIDHAVIADARLDGSLEFIEREKTATV